MKTPSPTPLFSIVIPVLNEEKLLPKLLQNLVDQSFPKDMFEVIVVDGKSNDKSVKAAEKFNNLLQLKIVTADKANVSTQRNLGTKYASAKWLLFMDADISIPPAFLDGIKYQLANDVATECFTCWIDETTYKTVDRPLITMLNLTIEVFARVKPGAPGAMIGVKQSLAKKYPFDPQLALSEDHDFIHTLVKKQHCFRIMRFPKYHFNLRRLESEGTLKLARTYAKAQLYLLMGKKIKQGDIDYPMGGDAHLDSQSWRQSTALQLRQNISEIMKHHRGTARKVLNWLSSVDS